MQPPPSTHASLFGHLRDPKDQLAWGNFVTLYRPFILSYVLSRRLHLTDAEDIWQEVLKAVLLKLPKFEYDPSKSFRGWLRTVTLNKIRDLARRRRREVRGFADSAVLDRLADLAIEEEADDFDVAYHRERLLNAVERVRGRFSEKTFAAFYETVVAGASVREVAQRLGLSENAVRIAKSRVLTPVKVELGLTQPDSEKGDAP